MALLNAPIPLEDPIARPRRPNFGPGQRDPQEGLVTDEWAYFLTTQQQNASQAPARVGLIQLTGQNAALPPTQITGSALNAGLYRISCYARITTAAGVSSSLTVQLGWTDNGTAVAGFTPIPAITGNLITSVGSWTGMIFSDANAPILYSTVYASNPASAMQYSLYVTLEQINA